MLVSAMVSSMIHSPKISDACIKLTICLMRDVFFFREQIIHYHPSPPPPPFKGRDITSMLRTSRKKAPGHERVKAGLLLQLLGGVVSWLGLRVGVRWPPPKKPSEKNCNCYNCSITDLQKDIFLRRKPSFFLLFQEQAAKIQGVKLRPEHFDPYATNLVFV